MIRNYMIRLKENSVSFSGWDRRGRTVFLRAVFCDMAGRKKQDDFAGPP